MLHRRTRLPEVLLRGVFEAAAAPVVPEMLCDWLSFRYNLEETITKNEDLLETQAHMKKGSLYHQYGQEERLQKKKNPFNVYFDI